MELFQMALIKMDRDCVSAVSIATNQQPPTKPKPAVTLCSLHAASVSAFFSKQCYTQVHDNITVQEL